MNNAYFYSAKTNAFYVSSLMSDYEGAGTLPDVIKEISTRWYEYLINGQAMGKIISSDEYGQPVLTEPAPPTAQELRAIAEGKKSQLMREAGEAIAILQDAVDLGISTEEENESILALRSYRVLVSRVDVDDPVWPEKP